MEGMDKLKVFTVSEANQLIPRLEAMLRELKEKRASILSDEVEIDALELIADKDEENQSALLRRKVEEYNHKTARFYAMVDEIQALGCFLKDIEVGLIDFYTIYEGRVVYLCWKAGEKEVGFWHEVGRGYSYRQPIQPQSEERESSG